MHSAWPDPKSLLCVTDKKLAEIQSGLERKIDFTNKRVRRIFNNGSFKQGGRWYGGWWQNIQKKNRQYIRINDKDVVECDYSGLHINMLYAMDKLPMPEGDVYRIPGYSNDKVFRDFVKRMLLIMVNSENREKARKALHSEVHIEKKLILPSEIKSTGGKDLFPLMDAFESKHKPISHYFCSGKGIDLQNLDSQMAETVLLHFTEGNFAILPMHDSFILHHGLEGELRDVMDKAFKDLFGVGCKVDLKYNSIQKRHERNKGKPKRCDDTVQELFESQRESSIYYDQLSHHWKQKVKN